jgi:hypothetical protein
MSMTRFSRVRGNVAFAGATLIVSSGVAFALYGAEQNAFPTRLENYFSTVLKLTTEERQALQSGAPVTRQLQPADPGKEIALFGAIWIAAPAARYVAALNDIENFESGAGFRATKKISEPARIEDFAALTLPDDDIQDLRDCRVGDCEVKLGADGLERIRKQVDWSRPDAKAQVEQLIQTMGVAYVNAYREGGNSRLAVYRDSSRPTYVAKEFQELIDGMPEFSDRLSDMRQFLLEYPKSPTRPTTSFIYWQEAEFGLKPTVRISHVAIQESPDATVVASKQLYSSHYFWTALELRVLMPDPSRGEGFWFVTVTRSRSDGLGGVIGRMIRGKIREASQKGVDTMLTATRNRIQGR